MNDINRAKLKYFCEIKSVSFKELSEHLGMHITTFYRKFNNENGDFTRNEILMIKQKLDLRNDEIQEIFFD